MRIGIISGVIGVFITLSVHAQKSDSIKSMLLPDVVVTETYQQRQVKKSALTVDIADQDFLRKHFTGNFMQAMENIPGVQAMDIGSGFSKPMIRGMGCIGKRNQTGRTTMGSRSRFRIGCLQYRSGQCFERPLLIALWQ